MPDLGLPDRWPTCRWKSNCDMIQVNVAALTHLTRLFLPGMIERRSGGILNVGSTAGFQPGPYMAVYYATKAYVLSFTEALAEELIGSGVRVTCLAPGATATEFAAAADMENKLLFRLGTVDARTVAQAGYRGFRRGRLLVIPGRGTSWQARGSFRAKGCGQKAGEATPGLAAIQSGLAADHGKAGVPPPARLPVRRAGTSVLPAGGGGYSRVSWIRAVGGKGMKTARAGRRRWWESCLSAYTDAAFAAARMSKVAMGPKSSDT